MLIIKETLQGVCLCLVQIDMPGYRHPPWVRQIIIVGSLSGSSPAGNISLGTESPFGSFARLGLVTVIPKHASSWGIKRTPSVSK